MKRLLFILIAILSFSQSIFSQSNCDRWYIGVNYTFLQPLSDFKSEGFQQAHGASFDLFYALTPYDRNFDIHAGLRLNGIVGKNIKNNITISDPAFALAESKIYNSVFDAKLLVRGIYRKYERFSPYVEGFGGLRAVAGHESIELQQNYSGYEKNSSVQLAGQANWVVGGSVGVLLKITPKVEFDLRAGLDYSPEFEYINMDTYQINENDITFDFSKTPGIDYTLHVGFRFKLDCRRNVRNNNYPRTRSPRHKRARKIPTKKLPKTTTKS